MTQQYVVTLKAMRFHTRIGVLPHEAEIAQSIEVDVSVWVTRKPGSHGSEGVVDYRRLYELVGGIVGAGHIRYLEDLADRVADDALRLADVTHVEIRVRKPHVALSGPLQYAEVTLERSRDD